MVTKVRERLAVSKQAAQNSDVEISNLRKISDMEVRKRYQIKMSNRFAALGNLSDNDDINKAWENLQENIKKLREDSPGVYELKQH